MTLPLVLGASYLGSLEACFLALFCLLVEAVWLKLLVVTCARLRRVQLEDGGGLLCGDCLDSGWCHIAFVFVLCVLV